MSIKNITYHYVHIRPNLITKGMATKADDLESRGQATLNHPQMVGLFSKWLVYNGNQKIQLYKMDDLGIPPFRVSHMKTIIFSI